MQSQQKIFVTAPILILFFALFQNSTNAQTIYSNTNPIVITDSAPATPFPSGITVSNAFGVVGKVTLKLNNLSHSFPGDVDIMLVGPGGQSALVMSDVGGSNGVSGITVTIDDDAVNSMPTPLVSGTYKPTNNDTTTDVFPPPAPTNINGTTLSVFNGTNPNGNWFLYVRDDVTNDSGIIEGGWEISITIANQFQNTNPITFFGFANTNPYPSAITVAGLTGRILKVQVKLNGLTHSVPGEMDLMLVGPNGRSIMLMSDAGTFVPVNNLSLTFDDASQNIAPYLEQLVSGTYKPTDHEPGDFFLGPAPQTLSGTTLSTFNGIDPNGVWSLFGIDDAGSGTGAITNGWSLTFELSQTGISIPQAGAADPYPSQIAINGVNGSITKVTVSITNFFHSLPDDVDILLVGPSDRSVVLMSDVGGNTGVSNLNFTFDDAALNSLPDASVLASGVYKPTNIDAGDTFPAPAPQGQPTGTTLSAFNGSSANGIWKLFIVDDNGNNFGSIGGWSINIESSASACNFTYTPNGQAFSVAGGVGNFGISIPAGCTWNVSTTANFINFISPVSGSGSSTISFSIPQNPGVARTAIINITNGIMSRTFLIQQESGCPVSLSQSSFNYSPSGGGGNLNVTANQACSWLATVNVNWIQINSAQQSGNGTVSFTVQRNITPMNRSAVVTVGAHSFSVSQDGSSRRSFDFDGDSKSDVSIFRPSDATWYVMRSSQTGTYITAQFGLATDKLAPADYDGDSKADIAVYRNGQWYVLQSQSGVLRVESWGTTNDMPVPGDYDGDSKADVAVYRPSESVWYIQRSSDGSLYWKTFGSPGESPVQSDYDGDGRTDIAVYRRGKRSGQNSLWQILQSSNGNVISQYFGVSGDIAVPADYNGDGRDNMAVFRPSNGTWYILHYPSSSYSSFQWGMAGDIPVAADYDGDRLYDFAVFRNGVWYIAFSGSGAVRTESWGMKGDKPVPSVYTAE